MDAEKHRSTTTISNALQLFPKSLDLLDAYRFLHPIGSDTNPKYLYTNNGGMNNRRIDTLFVSRNQANNLEYTTSLGKVSTHIGLIFAIKITSTQRQPGQSHTSGPYQLPGFSLVERESLIAIRKWILYALTVAAAGYFNPFETHIYLKRYLEIRISQDLCITKHKAARLRALYLEQSPKDAIIPKQNLFYHNSKDAYNPSAESMNASHLRAGKPNKKTNIEKLTLDTDEVLTDQKEIGAYSNQYYTDTFSETPTSTPHQNRFLDHIPKDSKLDQKECDNLEADFTEAELFEAIEKRKKNKQSGPDGIPYEFYQTFFPELKKHLLELYNYIGIHGIPDPELVSARVILIPKPGKAQDDLANWRPISLMNTDMKIYSHLLNNRIKPLVPKMVHPDQCGFVHKRIINTNLDTVDQLFHSGQQWTIGLIDFAKAFDSVSHNYIRKALKAFGFGPRMLQRIVAIQTNSNSKLLINGSLSMGFPLKAGVRQGCPLSPSVFALSAEPLLIALRNNLEGLNRLPQQMGFHAYNNLPTPQVPLPNLPRQFNSEQFALKDSSDRPFKLAAFADDIAIFFNSPEDIRRTGWILNQFRQASALAINPKKTIIQEVSGDLNLQHFSSSASSSTQEVSGDLNPQQSFHSPQEVSGDLNPRQSFSSSHEVSGNLNFTLPYTTDLHPDSMEALSAWEEPPTTAPRGSIFKYLGVTFGDAKAVEQQNLKTFNSVRNRIIKFPMWGLDTRGRCWMLTAFILSKLIYISSYSTWTNDMFDQLTILCCNKVNDILVDVNVTTTKPPRRRHRNSLLTAPTKKGGFGLLNFSVFGPNLRLVRAARVLGLRSHASYDFLTQFFNQGPYVHMCHNLLLAHTANPESFIHEDDSPHLNENFASSTASNPMPTHNNMSAPIIHTSEAKIHTTSWDSFDNNKFDHPKPWINSTSPSFVLALEQLALFCKDNEIPLEPWIFADIRQHPTTLNLVKRRQNQRGVPAYPSRAEQQVFFNTIRFFIMEDDEEKLVTITPYHTKTYWKDSIPLQWPKYWQFLFQSMSPSHEIAEERWLSSSGQLFSYYCNTPKLGQFLNYLVQNKLNAYITDGKPSPFYKYTKKGCGLCHNYPYPNSIQNRDLVTHILCTCPVVTRALAELNRPRIQGLAELAFVSRRKKEPDKPRIAYALWYSERGLRQLGLDGHDPDIFEALKAYIEFTANHNNPIITFRMFVGKPLFQ